MTDTFLNDLRAAIGSAHVITDPDRLIAATHESRGRWQGEAIALLRPGTTAEVAACVKLCAAHSVAITPQGGNTGLVGGGVPFGGVVLSLGRLNRIRAVDALNSTLTVEAGCTLAEVQTAAAEAGRLFPLSLASEGSCTIGGNLSTNAGGTAVLRYGNTRDLTLGIEAVLPDGRILNLLSALRKDNTGYALKDLLIGAEGTLGIITACVVKLFPAPLSRATAFAGLKTPEDALATFDILRRRAGEHLVAFEYLERFGIEIVTTHLPGARDPLETAHPAYALIELTSADGSAGLNARLEEALSEAMEAGLVEDAVIANSEGQRAALWSLRESMSEMQKYEGASIKHDIAVPVSRVAEFVTRGKALCEALLPGLRPCPFGHFGDGNLHFNLTRPRDMSDEEFLALYPQFNQAVHDLVAEMNGSISAEHGIGLAKREELPRYKDPVALALCTTLKRAIDPQNIMNPGKVLNL
ncbi:FAD-binding oxidoreductase [Falsigemmobacter faecalis]|uniref:FAD-binding oxidoreductase n=1 Tax=Falsigemmobacter faecalis TaxID=2488730 RepID=A0A3P3DVB6_9RHOB|nr:FAD-binding oxidoreductase [Falsigemmobacter faecalis]RRH78115.1 FAD-binding oxidoreductase [Falsigemmobacter faecalis]